MNSFQPLEIEVLQSLLAGDDQRLVVLRAQLERATVKEREMTGVGFFLHMNIPADAPRIPNSPKLIITGPEAEIEGLDYGAGFVLWVSDGALDQLEGYCCA